MVSSYSEKQKADALKLYVEYGPAEAGRRTSIPRGTISQWARRQGLVTVRSVNARAGSEAAKVSLIQRKQALAEKLMGDVERLREQLWQPAKVHDFTKDGEFVTGELEEPAFGDKRQIMTSLGIAVDKIQLLTGAPTSRSEIVEASRLDQEIERLLGEMNELDGNGSRSPA
jgi:hypothetical protein